MSNEKQGMSPEEKERYISELEGYLEACNASKTVLYSARELKDDLVTGNFLRIKAAWETLKQRCFICCFNRQRAIFLKVGCTSKHCEELETANLVSRITAEISAEVDKIDPKTIIETTDGLRHTLGVAIREIETEELDPNGFEAASRVLQAILAALEWQPPIQPPPDRGR